MRLPFAVVVVLFASSTWAQTVPNPFHLYQPLAQVKDFLQLSESQVQAILANNDEYNRWSAEKQTRIRQVQSEIANETGKDPLDPNSLGIRYAEVETICRDMKEQAGAYRTRNMDVLSPDQKTRLKILEDAMKLAPIISEARNGNLVGGLTSAPYAFTSTSVGIGGSVIGGIIGPVSGCSLPFPINRNIISANRNTAITPLPGNRVPARWFDTTKFAKPATETRP